MLNLDTHIVLYLLTEELTHQEREILAGSDNWSISAIVLWEVQKLASLGRIDRDLDNAELSLLLAGLRLIPLDLAVARALSSLDFRSDPADEIIAATSLAHNMPLLTRDARLLGSKVVPLALS